MKKSYFVFFVIILLSTSVFANRASAKYSMSYLDFFYKNSYTQLVDNTKNSIGTVTPNYFSLNADGSLKINADLDSAFINQMHNSGVKVVPFLNDKWGSNEGENALAIRDKLSTQIADAIKQYNLDGVNIDFESLNETNRTNFADFIRLVNSKLPTEKEVSVAVAANPNGWKTGWHGSYDYSALSQYADHLMVMAYDESWAGSDPGPVASLPFVERSITYATVTNQVSPSKIVLGLPFYGRIWKLNDSTTNINGDSISLSKVPNLLTLYNANVQFSDAEGSPYAKFTIHSGDPAFRLTSWSDPLEPGEYIVWYENEKSFKGKLRLIQQYNLKGAGSWSLGQEDTSVWNYYSLWLNGKYFSDVPLNHWAKDVIMAAEQKGWIRGTSSTTFSPEKKLTRAEGAVILVRALELQAKNELTQSFTDVPTNYWSYWDIEVAKQNQLFGGISDTKFGPKLGFTREQMAVVLHRMLGSDGQVASPTSAFSDVKPTDWSYESIMIMQQRGIFGGYKDGTFKPDQELTRAEMAALMDRISGYITN